MLKPVGVQMCLAIDRWFFGLGSMVRKMKVILILKITTVEFSTLSSFLSFFSFLSPSLIRLDYSHWEPVFVAWTMSCQWLMSFFCLLLFLLRLCAKNWLCRINASAHLWSYFMFFLIILIGLTKRDWDACLIVFSRAHILFLSVFIHFISLFIFITTVCALVSSL